MDELEIWKEIPGFDGCFASNIGNIKTLDRMIEYKVGDRVVKRFVPGKIINKRLMSRGYLAVFLHKDGIRQTFLVHRLVAAAFLGEQSDLTVNHKDGNKLNNHISNLERLTLEDNQKHYNEYLRPLKASVRNKKPKSSTKTDEIKVYGKEKEFAVLKEVIEDKADEKTILKYSKTQIKIKKQKGNKRFRNVLKDIYGFDCECLTIISRQMDFYSFKEISDYLNIHTNTLLSLLRKGGLVNGLKIGIKVKH